MGQSPLEFTHGIVDWPGDISGRGDMGYPYCRFQKNPNLKRVGPTKMIGWNPEAFNRMPHTKRLKIGICKH